MADLQREFGITSNALKSRGCNACRDWLTECINFFRSEHRQYTLQQMEKFVFDQWILTDLRDTVESASFPPNLAGHLKITLQGKMVCQIESVIDIGHSSYSQIQKLRHEDVGNLQIDDVGKEFQQAWEPKSNRMLQLSLSDGKQTVKAIEYRPIPFLKAELYPGTKILIQGPVLCRRGIIMLEERHVTELGGEIDALIITNAYENVLARRLNLPENPDPYKMAAVPNQQPAVQQDQPRQQPPNQTQSTIQNPAPQNAIQQPYFAQPEPRLQSKSNVMGDRKFAQPPLPWSSSSKQTCKPCNGSSVQTQALEFCGSDEDFLNIPLNEVEFSQETDHRRPSACTEESEGKPVTVDADYDMMGSDEEALLLEAEANLGLSESSTRNSDRLLRAPTIEKASGVHRYDMETISSKRSASSALPEENLKKPLFAKRRKETSSQEVSSTTDLNFLVADDFLDFEEASEDVSCLSDTLPVNLPHHPFVYLAQVIQAKSPEPKVYRVKAAVITVTEKLSISGDEWKLSAKISDGSSDVAVKFSSEVLEVLIGMSAKTMTELKKQMVHQPEKKEVVRKKLESAQRRLINLNCLLDIQVCDNEELPVVVGLDGISLETVEALKSRQVLA